MEHYSFRFARNIESAKTCTMPERQAMVNAMLERSAKAKTSAREEMSRKTWSAAMEMVQNKK
jgi:hypothetical protein